MAEIKFIPSSNPTDLEKCIEERMGITPSETVIKKFANGETYINIKEDMRNKDVYIMPVTGISVNDNLMEIYLKADSAKRMGAHRVVAIMPNFPYGRQERRIENGEPISARLNLALLYSAGIDEIITTDMHAPALQGFAWQIRLTEVSSLNTMINYFKDKFLDPKNLVVVSPDLGGVKRAARLANALDCERAVIYKHRSAHNVAKAENLLGNVQDKDVIIYDDIIDTAGTITEAAKMVKAHGAKCVFICASHGLFSGDALMKLSSCDVAEVVVSNSEHAPKQDLGIIKQVDISEEIINVIQSISASY